MNNKFAFTLSEVLISLAIIGVVAAMTLPILISKINDIQYTRAREKALKTIGEAGKIIAVQGNINDAVDAESFVKNYLSKHLKIAKYCGSSAQDIINCGFASQITTLGGTKISNPRTIGNLNWNYYSVDGTGSRTSYAIVLGNGYSANVFYNPNCRTLNLDKDDLYGSESVCLNVIYDMNGSRRPNEIGKDMGWVSVIGNNESVVAVAPVFERVDSPIQLLWEDANQYCLNKGLRLPTWYELESGSFNNSIGKFAGYNHWTINFDKKSNKGLTVGPNGGNVSYNSGYQYTACIH